MTTPTKEDFEKAREIVHKHSIRSLKNPYETLSEEFAQALADQREKLESEKARLEESFIDYRKTARDSIEELVSKRLLLEQRIRELERQNGNLNIQKEGEIQGWTDAQEKVHSLEARLKEDEDSLSNKKENLILERQGWTKTVMSLEARLREQEAVIEEARKIAEPNRVVDIRPLINALKVLDEHKTPNPQDERSFNEK